VTMKSAFPVRFMVPSSEDGQTEAMSKNELR
jgi:hypothetical protein